MRRKRYKIEVLVNMNNPFNAIMYGRSRSIIERGLTRKQAVSRVKSLKKDNPDCRYRIRSSSKKGISAMKIGLGFVLFIFCLAIASIVPNVFSYSTEAENLIQAGFMVLGIFGLFVGVMK